MENKIIMGNCHYCGERKEVRELIAGLWMCQDCYELRAEEDRQEEEDTKREEDRKFCLEWYGTEEPEGWY